MSSHDLHDAANDPQYVVFPLRRARPKLALLEPAAAPAPTAPSVEFVIATDATDFAQADALVRRCYDWRGYRVGALTVSEGETTLLARCGGDVIGTITVRGGVRARLQAEAGFAEHLDALRKPGRRLVEYTRFAVDREAQTRHGLDADLAFSLIERALLIGHLSLGATDCVIEVNPRHARYYERRFGFRHFGAQQDCERVGAPARLLHLNLDIPPACIVSDHGALRRPEPRLH
jgi:hypothetical protein